jgi:DNA-binding GntR family transcriptional regulator
MQKTIVKPDTKLLDKPATSARATLHEGLVARLREMIQEGLLPPGRRVAEVELCEEFQVSRTPMREALKVLAAEGWLQWRANYGATVSEVNPEEIDAMFETMSALERQIGRLAAERASDEEIRELQGLHDQLDGFFRSGDRVAYFKMNQVIHNRLAEATANHTIADIYHSLSAKVYRARSLANGEHMRWEQSLHEHAVFMDALKKRDGIAFGEALEVHSEKTRIAVVGELRRSLQAKARGKAST